MYLKTCSLLKHGTSKRFFGGQVSKLNDFLDSRTISFENGNQLKENERTFSNKEMENRLNVLSNKILNNDKTSLDFALFTSYHNINYYSDFLYCSFGRSYGLVVPNTQNESINISNCSNVLITANIDGGQGYRRIGGYPENNSLLRYSNKVYTDWQKDNYLYSIYESINECLNKNNTNDNKHKILRIGIEADHISITKSSQLKKYLELKLDRNVEFVDISENVMKERMIKSKEEQILIENGAKVANIGGYKAIEVLTESLASNNNNKLKEIDVANECTKEMVNAISDMYPTHELRDSWTWFQSGINCDGAHNPVTSKIIEKGDILSLNCFPMIAGYYTALERTMFYHHVPTKEQLKVWQVNCEVHKKGQTLLVEGNKISDIVLELNEIFLENDLLEYRTFGYGHSFGVLCHYYGREAGLELREDNDLILKENMVVSMEPMLAIPENKNGYGGYREHDILIVQPNKQAPKNITNFPFGPEYNIIS